MITENRIRTGRRVVSGLWVALCAFQISIWMIGSIVSLDFVNPWWLWTVAVGGIVISGMWWVTDKKLLRA